MTERIAIYPCLVCGERFKSMLDLQNHLAENCEPTDKGVKPETQIIDLMAALKTSLARKAILTKGDLIRAMRDWDDEAQVRVQIRDEAEVAGVSHTSEVEIDGINDPDVDVQTCYIKVTF